MTEKELPSSLGLDEVCRCWTAALPHRHTLREHREWDRRQQESQR